MSIQTWCYGNFSLTTMSESLTVFRLIVMIMQRAMVNLERKLKESSSLFLTFMYNADGPNISPFEIVIIVSGEGRISVSFTSELNWEALAFPKDYST